MAVFFQHMMSGQLPVMGITPIADLFHEVVAEKSGTETPKADTHGIFSGVFHKEQRQFGKQFAAVGFAVFVFKNKRPEETVTGKLGFIGEDAAEIFLQELRQIVVVELVRNADEFFHDFGIEVIHIVDIEVVVAAEDFAAHAIGERTAQKLRTVFGIKGDRTGKLCRFGSINDFVTEVLLLIIHTESVDQTAAETGRPAVFVVKPGIHIELLSFIKTGGNAIKPLLRQVFRLQAAAGVHEKAAQAGFGHFADLPAEFFGFEFVVPAPKRSGTILVRDDRTGNLHFIFHLEYFISKLCSIKDNRYLFNCKSGNQFNLKKYQITPRFPPFETAMPNITDKT